MLVITFFEPAASHCRMLVSKRTLLGLQALILLVLVAVDRLGTKTLYPACKRDTIQSFPGLTQ